ncbi:MAG: hypothetical protein A3F33_00010 [Candidatus Woykebacteria bacterium RIFCSPHIGHO2_12_FULL_43_10]|uniref:tRNA N6-adenosine threonylcarbamoyltransferase n=1 Tax=Candidatus Woykebacteria bacterium RIFCSPHIGHO2_02_FULL_43_16b TaxID=1802601 RepID=A0A1G1WMG6_9BACT|nr:MAG: hypothetical protein A3J50_03700 [Candidatus Woykebacteria bacterium RIFCSPHIGHO2_02_FULL_43_16b]OGY30122.1 MAG: hypothetical protein A3F33_00010 [Candidatus Woykebacteria bacterium RIFCSPHIGHO2_12_FULL_43_10]
MRILGIETSCDETAAAIVENGKVVLSTTLASSLQLHAKTGGIIPEIAARDQVKAIIPVLETCFSQICHSERSEESLSLSEISSEILRFTQDDINNFKNSIDAIAVTTGPGLIGSLLVGVETAKALAFAWHKPLIPVNHLVGHFYANWLTEDQPPSFPFLFLLVSGGHTDLVIVKDHGVYEWVGGTRDDAAGEAFDKTARLLGFDYPGGPKLSKLAESGNSEEFKLPRPMINSGDFDFSFSGLKTAVLTLAKDKQFTDQQKANLACSIEEAIVEVLVKKTVKAAKEYGTKEIALGGGVVANRRLREAMKENWDCVHIPPPSLCTDNASVIAAAAFYNQKEIPWQEVKADPSLHF